MQQVKQPLTIALRKQSDNGTTQISLGFFLLIFSLCFFSFTPVKPVSQKQDAHQAVTQRNKIDAWIFDKIVDNVECYHMIADCSGKKAVFLKFNNKNNYKVKLSWKEGFDTQFEKHTKGATGQKQFVLSKGEMVQGSCSSAKFREGFISPEQITPTYVADIQDFEYIDIKVTRVQ
jgi:hypothetical protein